jgi:CRP-like cAMP-binding protein
MIEEFWSESVRLMDLVAECRATVARTRAMVDDSWTAIRQASKTVEGELAFRIPSENSSPRRETNRTASTTAQTPRQAAAPVFAAVTAMPPAITNRILLELPAEGLELIMSKAKRVKLRRGQVLEQPRVPVAHAYFIESGIVALQAVSKGGGLLASGLIGSDGMTGLPIILRSMKMPLKAQVLIAGEAWRISAEELQVCLQGSGASLSLLLSYVQAMLVQSAYVGLCSARHTARQRIRSWLLLAAAALGEDAILSTHQAMAKLLGLRRATVSDCLAELQKSHAICQKRGCVVVLDQNAIARGACDCHRVIGAELRHLWTKQPQRLRIEAA